MKVPWGFHRDDDSLTKMNGWRDARATSLRVHRFVFCKRAAVPTNGIDCVQTLGFMQTTAEVDCLSTATGFSWKCH